jgi:hypothetical protein
MTKIKFNDLPALGQPFAGGTFAGITTQKDGTHMAVVLLPDQASNVTWQSAMDWAKGLDAVLPTRPIAALLFANLQPSLRPEWRWTSDEDDASYAWGCCFHGGDQSSGHKSFEGSAVAVRLVEVV